jgi:hypothetical protein
VILKSQRRVHRARLADWRPSPSEETSKTREVVARTPTKKRDDSARDTSFLAAPMALQHALLPAASRAAAVGGRILSRRPSVGARPASCAATLRGFASVSRARLQVEVRRAPFLSSPRDRFVAGAR